MTFSFEKLLYIKSVTFNFTSEKANVAAYATSATTVFCMNYCIKGRAD